MRLTYYILLASCLLCLVQALPHPQEEDQEEGGGEEDGDDLVGAPKIKYALGLVEPNEEDRVDEESVAFFQDAEENLVGAPLTYNAVSLGLVTPVKNQGNCGSCAAFASAAMMETCYRKLTKKVGLFSEQQLVDCGFGFQGANACNGAPLQSYLEWAQTKQRLAGSAKYPYTAVQGICKSPDLPLLLDAKVMVKNSYYTYSGTEDLLKTMVADRSAVVVGMWFNAASLNAFYSYRSGVFNGCTTDGTIIGGHAVTVVGYGSVGGQDYWLVKNSWGTGWGEKGFFKIRRGVGACRFGQVLSVIDCGAYAARRVGAQEDCAEGDESCAAEQEEGEDANVEEENTEAA